MKLIETHYYTDLCEFGSADAINDYGFGYYLLHSEHNPLLAITQLSLTWAHNACEGNSHNTTFIDIVKPFENECKHILSLISAVDPPSGDTQRFVQDFGWALYYTCCQQFGEGARTIAYIMALEAMVEQHVWMTGADVKSPNESLINRFYASISATVDALVNDAEVSE
jgi:hypothetical protein